MKVLMVSGTFPPRNFGGVTAVSYNLARRLVKRRHEITVYTTDVGNDFHSRLNVKDSKAIEGINVYHFRNLINSLAFKQRIYSPIGMITQTKKELQNFDIIHLHEYRSFQNVIVHYYAKKYSIPYILQAHGSVVQTSSKKGLKKLFDLAWGSKILEDASKVIALTKTEAEQYTQMGVDENKIEIVQNGINLSEYKNLPNKGTFKKKYGIKSNEKIVLYLGRIHQSKGIDLLVETFSDISKEITDLKLVLAGPDDGFKQSLVETIHNLKIDNKVLFTGFVSNDEKIAAFVDSEVFVTPSFSGFPVTFLEACACGTPIVTTKKGDYLAWIDGKVGYVVKYDTNELRDAIFKIVTDSSLRNKFCLGCKEITRTNDWSVIASQLEHVYISAISGDI
jgi:glycosyltransferase involved in cell wall biosynthesis